MLKKFLRTKRGLQFSEKYQPKQSIEMLEMCKKCYSFKYNNGRHFERPEYLLENDPDEKISVQFSQCPACIEESLAIYDMEYV